MAPDLLIHLRGDPILRPYLVGVDASQQAIGRTFVDNFYVTPWGDDPGYIDAMVGIVAREKIDLILPGSDQEAFRLSAEREKLAKVGAVVLASPPSVLDLIRDKWATYRALKDAGLRIPEFVCTNGVEELKAALCQYGYPRRSVIVKPIAGRGGRGMRLLVGADEIPPAWIGTGARECRHQTQPNDEELMAWTTDTLMVMPLLYAPAYDVDVLAVHGQARAVLVRRRNNPAGIPFTGNRIVSDPAISDYCRDVAQVLGLDALHDIDLMTDAQGRPCLLEVNPRPSGSAVAAHAAGYPIVAAAIAEHLGRSYPLEAPTQDIDIIVVPRATAVMARSGPGNLHKPISGESATV